MDTSLFASTQLPVALPIPVANAVSVSYSDAGSNAFLNQNNSELLQTDFSNLNLLEAGTSYPIDNVRDNAVGLERRQIDWKPVYVAFFNTVSNIILLAGWPRIASLVSVVSMGITFQLGKSSDVNERILRGVGSLTFFPFLYLHKDLFSSQEHLCNSFFNQSSLKVSSFLLPANHLLLISKECGVPALSQRQARIALLSVLIMSLGLLNKFYFNSVKRCS